MTLAKVWTPRPYQGLMRDFMIDRQRCNIWAEPGMGKTSATLAALDVLWMAGSHFWPAIVIGPKKVAASVWAREVKEWADFNGMRVAVAVGDEATRLAALRSKADIYCINFENVEWLFDALKNEKAWPFKVVIVDEATRLKGFRLRNSTKRSKALASICARVGRWINLTGTPNPNGYIDLWGQQYFIDLGQRLGHSFTEYQDRYFNVNEYSRKTTMLPGAMEAINELLKDCSLTIRAKDWFDLREPIVQRIPIELPRKVMEMYKELEREMYVQLGDGSDVDAVNAAALSTKCLQVASGHIITNDKTWREVHTEKLDAIENIVDETNGAPLMVGYWWRADGERLAKRFPYARFVKTPKDEDAWNEGRVPMILTQYQSIGHGVNLQHGGHRIAHFSRWWDLELDDQLRARLGPVRQIQSGYDRPVYEYELIAVGTADEQVSLRHKLKREVCDLLLDATRRFE